MNLFAFLQQRLSWAIHRGWCETCATAASPARYCTEMQAQRARAVPAPQLRPSVGLVGFGCWVAVAVATLSALSDPAHRGVLLACAYAMATCHISLVVAVNSKRPRPLHVLAAVSAIAGLGFALAFVEGWFGA